MKNSKKPNKSSVAERGCDQCCWDLQRCDKGLPICSNCRKADRECTRTSVTKFRALLNYKPVQISTSNNQNKKAVNEYRNSDSGAASVVKKKAFKVVPYRVIPGRVVAQTNSIRHNPLSLSDWTIFLKTSFQDPESRYKFYFCSRELGISIINSTHPEKMMIFKYINSINLSSTHIRASFHLHHNPNELEIHLIEAIESYFYNTNIFFPLFPSNPIYTKPRSNFLKACMCRMGLQYMKRSIIRTDIIKYLDRVIMNFIKPGNLKPSLSSLQSLLIIVFNCHSSPLLDHIGRLFSIAESWVHLLGLESTRASSRSIECQMALGLIHGFEYYFSNVINTRFLPPLTTTFKPTCKLSFVSFYFQEWSKIIKEATLYLNDSDHMTRPEIVFDLLKSLDSLVKHITNKLNKIGSNKDRIIKDYIILSYHFNYITLIDLIFKLNPTTLEKLSRDQISLLKRSGYVHSLFAIQKSIPIQNPAFISARTPLLLTVSKILNSWASPCPPCVYHIVRRNIMNANCESIQDQSGFALELVDHHFKK